MREERKVQEAEAAHVRRKDRGSSEQESKGGTGWRTEEEVGATDAERKELASRKDVPKGEQRQIKLVS